MANKVTIKDIAEAVGVSTSLVSFVMNNKGKRYRVSEEMTRKILDAAERLNYQPNNAARSLRSGKSHTIGVIISDISNKFFADIARCIEDHASRYDYTVIFGSSDENAAKLENLMQVMMNKGVDGLIIVPCEGSEEAIARVAEKNFPIVLLDRSIADSEISNVVLNNKKAAVLATESLIKNGYKKIDLIGYELNLTNVAEREAGFMQTMKKHGLKENIRRHKVKFSDIAGCMESIISDMHSGKTDTEAIVFATNTLTIEGLKAMRKFGMTVPDDIAVVGFDGSEAFELFYTSVSYIQQPIEQFGLEALELIIRGIEADKSQPSTASIVLNPVLVEQCSSQPKKQACQV